MIRSFALPCCRAIPLRVSRRAFTLVELLVVMAIMLVLAGLILSVAGRAQYNGSMSRARTEVQGLTTAMEQYKVDNGTYPRDATTDTLNAQTSTDPSASNYIAASKFLFTSLSGVSTGALTKAYFTFLPGQLSTGSKTPASGTTYIIDPFGFSYGYSTAFQAAQDRLATDPSTDTSAAGYNPTYDLWSTGGYSSGGKSYGSAGITDLKRQPTLWAKNW